MRNEKSIHLQYAIFSSSRIFSPNPLPPYYMGASLNYVGKILPIFDPLPSP